MSSEAYKYASFSMTCHFGGERKDCVCVECRGQLCVGVLSLVSGLRSHLCERLAGQRWRAGRGGRVSHERYISQVCLMGAGSNQLAWPCAMDRSYRRVFGVLQVMVDSACSLRSQCVLCVACYMKCICVVGL